MQLLSPFAQHPCVVVRWLCTRHEHCSVLPRLWALIPPSDDGASVQQRQGDGRRAWPLTSCKTLLSSFIYKVDQQKSFSLSVLQAFLTCHCLGMTWVASEGCSWQFPHPAASTGTSHSIPLLCDTAVVLVVPCTLSGDPGPHGHVQHLPWPSEDLGHENAKRNAGYWSRMSFKVPSNPTHPVIL